MSPLAVLTRVLGMCVFVLGLYMVALGEFGVGLLGVVTGALVAGLDWERI